jgi:outer membrane receptor protein involved in Fe transport
MLPKQLLLAVTTASVFFLPSKVLAEQESQNVEMDSIVILGEKSKKLLKDSASSVSVITDESMGTMQYSTISEAVSDLANVIALTGQAPDIRGVTGNGASGGFNSISGGAKARVSTLIDGVAEPFVADMTGDSGIWDIEQVEVYRGPQSTINGRNSIGGTVFIKTNDPTFDWEGAARLGYRTEEEYIDTSAMISGPIIDEKLAFRVTAQQLNAQTNTDETGYSTNTPDYDLNEIKTTRLKGKLLWKPQEDIDALLTYSSNDEQGDTGRVYYSAEKISDYERIYFRDISTKSDTVSLDVNYQISQNISVDVLAAVMDYQWGFDTYEADAANEQQLSFDESNTTLDAKINFIAGDYDLNGFVGLAYSSRDQDIDSLGAYLYNGTDESSSQSVYGEVDYALNDVTNIIVGGRVENEIQKRNFVYGVLAVDADLETDKTIFLPKVVVQYKASDETTLSLSARQGYNAAGGALNFTEKEYYYYDEEKVNTYEFGLRTSFDDGAVNLSANVFYNDFDGYQALSSTRFIVNMDEVSTYGAELELMANITQDLEINTGLGLLKTDIKDAGADYDTATGNELNSAPNMTANIGAKYWMTHDLDFGISAKYVGEYFGDISNSKDRVAGDYTLVRLNANYSIDDWKISAFVNNATDEQAVYLTEPASARYPSGYVSVATPRTLGVSATYTF